MIQGTLSSRLVSFVRVYTCRAKISTHSFNKRKERTICAHQIRNEIVIFHICPKSLYCTLWNLPHCKNYNYQVSELHVIYFAFYVSYCCWVTLTKTFLSCKTLSNDIFVFGFSLSLLLSHRKLCSNIMFISICCRKQLARKKKLSVWVQLRRFNMVPNRPTL